MPTLVEELQQDALSDEIPVNNLLRKALVVATKLKLKEFQIWVEHELKDMRTERFPTTGF